MYIYVSMYECMYLRTYVRVYVCTYAYMYVVILYVCMYVCRHVCTHLCMYICMHVCIYVSIHECMYGKFSNTIWYIFVLVLIFLKSEFLSANSVPAILTIKNCDIIGSSRNRFEFSRQI